MDVGVRAPSPPLFPFQEGNVWGLLKKGLPPIEEALSKAIEDLDSLGPASLSPVQPALR